MRSSLVLLATLLACGAMLSAAAGADVNRTAEVVSERVQAVLRLDRAYAAQQRAESASSSSPSLGAESESKSLGFVPTNLPYSYAVASKLFWHSVSAYCLNNPALHQWSCASCKQFGPFTVTAVMDDPKQINQGYVGYFTQGLPASPIPGSYVRASDPFVLLSFRGTVSTLADWIEDLSFAKQAPFSSAYPNVKVHGGFWTGYQSLRAEMMAGLQLALAKTKANTIIVTGHSLGGAMADLAALDLKLTAYPQLNFAVYTQGTPRVGNAAWSSLYAASVNASFREVHAADVVPHLPPMLLGFQHARTELWFDEPFTHFSYCNATTDGEDPACSDSVKLPISVSDHVTYRGVEMGQYCGSHAQLSDEQRHTLRAAEQTEAEQVEPHVVSESIPHSLLRGDGDDAADAEGQLQQAQAQAEKLSSSPKPKRILTEM